MSEYKVIQSKKLSHGYDKRYIVVDLEGNVLDNAQGYGYKSPQKAHAAYRYKTRDRSKDAEKAARDKMIRKWMKENKDFVKLMDQIAFEIAKGSWGPDDKFDAKLVKKLLKDSGYADLPFTPGQLLKCWENGTG